MKESSLTAPHDRDPVNKAKIDQFAPPLRGEELSAAVAAKFDGQSIIRAFAEVERCYVDPPIELQKYVLVSFVPSKGATPDEHGIFGFMKVRGSYDTIAEANARAERIVADCDSINTIRTAYVGRPFPITAVEDKFSGETARFDPKENMTKTFQNTRQNVVSKETQMVNEMIEREKDLIRTIKAEIEDPFERYCELKNTKAISSFNYNTYRKKLIEIKQGILIKVDALRELETAHPEFREKYLDNIRAKRKAVGLDKFGDENHMKFLEIDITLDELAEE